MEQENTFPQCRLQQASDAQDPFQTLLQQSTSLGGGTVVPLDNLGSEDVPNINILQLLRTCQFKKALSLLESTLSSKRVRLVELNVELVPLLNQMAEVQIALAQFSKASDLSHQSEQILQNHQDHSIYNSLMADTCQIMAVISRENQDYQEALDLVDKSLTLSSPDRPEKNVEKHRVKALILCDLQHYREALQEIQTSLDIAEKSTNPTDHLIRARVYNTLGDIRCAFYDFHQAKIAYETAMELCIKYDLRFHVEMAKACEGLGSSLIQMKKSSSRVLDLAESAERIYEECFEEDPHPAKISTLLLLARYFKKQKDPSKVHEYINLALEEGEAFYGPDCQKRREVCLSAARAAGKLYFKEYFVNPVLETATQGKDGPELVSLYLQQCEACLFCEDYDLFEAIFPEAVEAIRKIHGDTSLEMAKISKMMASFYQKRKQGKRVIDLLERYIGIYKEIFGENHIEIAKALMLLNDWISQSALYCEQALQIQFEFYGESHPIVVETSFKLAKVYFFNEDSLKSLKVAKKLLKAFEKVEGEKIYEAYQLMGMTYLKMRDTKNSSSYFRKSYQMARVKLGIGDARALDMKEWHEFTAEQEDLLSKSLEATEYF